MRLCSCAKVHFEAIEALAFVLNLTIASDSPAAICHRREHSRPKISVEKTVLDYVAATATNVAIATVQKNFVRQSAGVRFVDCVRRNGELI